MIRFFIYLVLICAHIRSPVSSERSPRWFFRARTVTKLVHEKSLVTESVPSSCVAVEPSLPPCRHVRMMDINPTPTVRIEATTPPERSLSLENWDMLYGPRYLFGSEPESKTEREEKENVGGKAPLSWAEYFGFQDVTVVKTAIHSITAKYYDPNTVVTFNVRGCHPSKLPFNLPLCASNATHHHHHHHHHLNVNSLSKDVHYAPP